MKNHVHNVAVDRCGDIPVMHMGQAQIICMSGLPWNGQMRCCIVLAHWPRLLTASANSTPPNPTPLPKNVIQFQGDRGLKIKKSIAGLFCRAK